VVSSSRPNALNAEPIKAIFVVIGVALLQKTVRAGIDDRVIAAEPKNTCWAVEADSSAVSVFLKVEFEECCHECRNGKSLPAAVAG
jgi:hypothetical protein